MDILKKMNRFFYISSKKIATAILAVLIVSLTAGILARYIFHSPFIWTEELATFLFIWLSFLGTVTASYSKRHVKVDFLVKKLPKKVQDIINIIAYVFIMLFMIMLVVGSFILFPTLTYKSLALHIPKWVYYLAICIAAIEMFFIYLDEAIEYIKDIKTKKEATV